MNQNKIVVPEKKRKSTIKAKKADRSMDNMFRIVLNNHLQLSAMADAKANMIITVCALMVTLSIGNIGDPSLLPAILCIGVTCILSILFAVYATLPKLPPKITGKVNPRSPNFNLIFFGFFTQLDFQTYLREMEQVMNDREIVYEFLAKDLYDLGKVLSNKKYRFVRISYIIFMIGLVISFAVLVYTITGQR